MTLPRNTKHGIAKAILVMVDGDGNEVEMGLNPDGSLIMDVSIPGDCNVTAVEDSDSSITLIAANPSRKRIFIYNRSSSPLRLRLGAQAAEIDLHTQTLLQGESFSEAWTGAVQGIWDQDNPAGEGDCMVTEIF